MLLGISGASFFLGTLNSWYYYILGGLFLAGGIYYQHRHQPVTVSLASRRRNRWLFPFVTVASGGAAYVLITFTLVPMLISFDTKPALLPQTELRVDETPQAKPASLRQAELRAEGMT